MLAWQTRFNRTVDRCITSPFVGLGEYSWPAYRFFLIMGFGMGILFGLSLNVIRGLSLVVGCLLVFVVISTMFSAAMGVKIVTGEEKLTNYHHQLVAIGAVIIALNLLGTSVLPYLDILGLSLLVGMGGVARMGCLVAGCCHGRPGRWGVCYSQAHALDGFPHYFVGTRLIPTQWLELVAAWGVLPVGLILLFEAEAGSAIVWYVVAYASVRFVLERWRADAQRPYWYGIGETQWLSLGFVWLMVLGGWLGWVPLTWWALFLAILLSGLMLFWIMPHRWQGDINQNIEHPLHIHEMARIVRLAPSSPTQPIYVETTSLGVRISAGYVSAENRSLRHYTLSQEAGLMGESVAVELARLIGQLNHSQERIEVTNGMKQGVFHVLVYPTSN